VTGRIFTIGWRNSGMLLIEKKTPPRKSIGNVAKPAIGPALSGFFAMPAMIKPSAIKAIKIYNYKEEIIDGLIKISVNFNVTSDEYHDITTLLYNGTFEVKVPDKDLSFKGTIKQYSTSFTNLYENDQVGDFSLSLLEVKH
jgi:hypothetical protein